MKILDENDKYLFIASQAIYKKLSNEEIVTIIKEHSSASGAAQEIMRKAQEAWSSHVNIEDCTCILLFLH
jgi:serine/threonine protein phosphatase PrpC